MSADTAQSKGARWGDLRLRVVSALAIGAVALACVWLGGIWIAALAAAAGAVMMAEWRNITALHVDEEPVRSGALFVFAVGWGPLATYARGVELALFGLVAMAIYGLVQDIRPNHWLYAC